MDTVSGDDGVEVTKHYKDATLQVILAVVVMSVAVCGGGGECGGDSSTVRVVIVVTARITPLGKEVVNAEGSR